jgi:hypothetical protein
VHKHVYVHVPPPDEEEDYPQHPVPTPTAQKHYKIIFIKAPSYAQKIQQSHRLTQANEEKTLVYVLSKKPEEPSTNIHDQVKEFTPSKPEVFFIKYKAQKEEVATPVYGVPEVVPGPVYGTPQYH